MLQFIHRNIDLKTREVNMEILDVNEIMIDDLIDSENIV